MQNTFFLQIKNLIYPSVWCSFEGVQIMGIKRIIDISYSSGDRVNWLKINFNIFFILLIISPIIVKHAEAYS